MSYQSCRSTCSVWIQVEVWERPYASRILKSSPTQPSPSRYSGDADIAQGLKWQLSAFQSSTIVVALSEMKRRRFCGFEMGSLFPDAHYRSCDYLKRLYGGGIVSHLPWSHWTQNHPKRLLEAATDSRLVLIHCSAIP